MDLHSRLKILVDALAEKPVNFNKGKTTILTATSGDTGVAVAHANKPDIDIVFYFQKEKFTGTAKAVHDTWR